MDEKYLGQMTQRTITGCMLIVLASAVLSAQQSATDADHPEKTQDASNQPREQQLKVTADETPACPNESYLGTLPKGVYWVGGTVTPPKALKTPKAPLSDEAREFLKTQPKGFELESIVELTVDAEGKPQDICIVKEVGYSLDRQAYRGVEHYRFRPATSNGEPVQVRIKVKVAFKLW